jgi:hypothetical protein
MLDNLFYEVYNKPSYKLRMIPRRAKEKRWEMKWWMWLV